jgi:predicted GNAT family N-acyltransferase
MVGIREIKAGETWALRQEVLRPQQPLSDMQFAGDEAPDTRHFGAWEENELVGIASFYREPLPERPGATAWRLRGMAVSPKKRRSGIGARLLEKGISHCRSHGGKVLWCNARDGALAFYSSFGFKSIKGPFELPGIGPHFLLALDL